MRSRMLRRKGRLIVVGDVGLGLERGPIYQREADFLISTSYGPGRYDPTYEEGGLDYPIAYVRWTENRNMEEFLRLLSTGAVTRRAAGRARAARRPRGRGLRARQRRRRRRSAAVLTYDPERRRPATPRGRPHLLAARRRGPAT